MELAEALYTTRAMRRVKPDPIPDDVIARIMDAGIRAPSGGNTQSWRFITVSDRATVTRIGDLYRKSFQTLLETVYKDRVAASQSSNDPRAAGFSRVRSSSEWLAENFDRVPLLIFGYARPMATGASIYPALWSMCLAARAEGIGSTLTTVLTHFAAKEVDEVLEVPADSGYEMAGMLPMGYPHGRWGIAQRRPAREVTYAERWGKPPSWEAEGPLWTG